MMERVDRAGQEEFIWAMRMRLGSGADEDNSSSWRDRLYSKTSLDTNVSIKVSESLSHLQTRVLASLVPDEVIYDCNNYTIRNYKACVLSGHISGFEVLYKKFNNSMTGGTSLLTQILNSYLGSMIQEILLFCGDVVKLNGDSFLAMWKPGINNQTMSECIHQAIDCSLSIQKTCGSFVVDADVTLKENTHPVFTEIVGKGTTKVTLFRILNSVSYHQNHSVKIIIVSGEMNFKLLGDERHSDYVLYGEPIVGTITAHQIVKGGEIAISLTTSDYININEYNYELLEDKTYAMIRGANTSWRSTQRNFLRTEVATQSHEKADNVDDGGMADIFELRPALTIAPESTLREGLKKFITPSVLRGIELGEPVEYLTELRNIVLLYIDIVIESESNERYTKVLDVCHRKIVRIVTQMEGTINHVSVRDTNARFVIIFGFRGFKHTLESRRGLSCATGCYEAVSKLLDIAMVSASVTTGMAYCGIIGHALRREYTVMSVGVKNASIFIETYPGKITCDRETFLQSKLDPMQFILQESHRVSISPSTPVYHYVEASSNFLPTYPVTQYPILDRGEEVKTYLAMLDKCKENEQAAKKPTDKFADNALIVHGRPKEGKTRLIEEFLLCTPINIPIYRIQLQSSDKVLPYQAVYLLFSVPLGIKENSTVTDREAKLISKLKRYESPQLYCMLNLVFNVNFEKSAIHNSLTENQKFYALNKIIKLLTYSCFTILWVVIIDGADNMDDESWSIIKTIIDTGKIFVVLTMTTDAKLSPIAELVLKSDNISTMFLYPVEKWYHVGLACQFLNVVGVPAELEKLLHENSNGNPGWIESFLICLVHSEALQIMSIPMSSLNEYGLVLAPTEMIERISETSLLEKNGSVSIEAKPSNSAIFFNIQDKWRIYKHSFRSSITELYLSSQPSLTEARSNMNLKKKSSLFTSKAEMRDEDDQAKVHMINICVINGIIDDISAEYTSDSFVIKILDYLTSYEQLLLKCSSVIGETLSRDMLNYLMNKDDALKCALAVQRLFEIGVLGCAQGRFSYGGSNAILNSPTISDSNAIECRCEGIKIPEHLDDLPKYANCGFLYFKIVSFRDMTYKLLTLDQRREFHFRAIRYLEKKTRKCLKCGAGYFANILGKHYEEVNIKRRMMGATRASAARSSTRSLDMRSIDRSVKEKSSACTFKSTNKSEMATSEGPAEDHSQLKYFQLVRSFSSDDFSSCDCIRILLTMYKQVVEHCEAVGDFEKWLVSNLEYGRLLIDTYNTPLALKVLNKTLTMFQENHSHIVRAGESWKIPFIKAKILTLIGRARMEIGQIKTSFTLLEIALKNFSYSFPSINSLKFKLTSLQQYMYLFHNKRYGMKVKHDYTAEYCDNVAECLNLLYDLFYELEMYSQAETTAKCSLKQVLQSERTFVILLKAFTSIISIYMMNRKLKYLEPLEEKSIAFCNDYPFTVDVRDLEAVTHLYISIFKARIMRCEFDRAIYIGNTLVKLCGAINTRVATFDMYPLLIQILVLKNRFYDAIMIFSMVEQSATIELDFYDLTWYYSLCVCFHLDTGYSVLDFRSCENYRFVEAQNYMLSREPSAQKRYFVALWLWLLRNGKFEEAEIWEAKIRKTWSFGKNERMVNLFTALYYLEGLILIIVFKMDRMDHLELDKHIAEINTLFESLRYHAEFTKLIEPRLYHLKAFYLLCIQQENEANNLMERARKSAVKSGNLYDENWIIHSELAWKQDMSAIDYHFWRDHATSDLLSHHLLENDDRVGFYTLEPPLYA